MPSLIQPPFLELSLVSESDDFVLFRISGQKARDQGWVEALRVLHIFSGDCWTSVNGWKITSRGCPQVSLSQKIFYLRGSETGVDDITLEVPPRYWIEICAAVDELNALLKNGIQTLEEEFFQRIGHEASSQRS